MELCVTNHIEIYAVFHAHRSLVLSLFNAREIINLFEWDKSIPLTEAEAEVAEYHLKCITHAPIAHTHTHINSHFKIKC